MNATNSAVPTIHSRKSPRRQFIVQPASQRQTRRRLATMGTGANYSLWMVGRQARHGGPTCVQKYILSEAGGRGRRRCDGEGPLRSRRCQNGTTRNTLSPKFFPKKFGQKIGAGPPTGNFGNGLCAGPGSAPPRPPFVQMKNTPGGPSRGADFQARHSARAIDHWVGRSAVGHQFHAHVTENISAPSH